MINKRQKREAPFTWIRNVPVITNLKKTKSEKKLLLHL